MKQGKNIYFLSDIHLGLYPRKDSRKREKKLVDWLDRTRSDAQAYYFVGDIFDFWWEYKKVVPKGFVRFLGKLAELTDQGIEVHVFPGNHDMWLGKYLVEECGVKLHQKICKTELYGKKFFITHGDGKGPGDLSYKLLKVGFTSKLLQWLFARLHPNFSFSLAHGWAKSSRYSKGFEETFHGLENERLYHYAKGMLEKEHFDYFIFGHRHIPLIEKIGTNSHFVYLGDWITSFSYGCFDGHEFNIYKES